MGFKVNILLYEKKKGRGDLLVCMSVVLQFPLKIKVI